MVTDVVDVASLAPQDEPLLGGGAVGGSDAAERLWGPSAPELDAPQVRGPLAPLWLVRADADEGCCWSLGSEARTSHPGNRSKDATANFSSTEGVRWIWNWSSSTMPGV